MGEHVEIMLTLPSAQIQFLREVSTLAGVTVDQTVSVFLAAAVCAAKKTPTE